MANFEVGWDNEAHTAIRFDVKTGCDWIEFWAAVHEAYRLMASVEHQVDLIINPEPGAQPPMRALMNFKRAQEESPANRRRLVIVGAGMYAELLVNAFSRIYKPLGNQILFVSNLEKARAALDAKYPSSTSRLDSSPSDA